MISFLIAKEGSCLWLHLQSLKKMTAARENPKSTIAQNMGLTLCYPSVKSMCF